MGILLAVGIAALAAWLINIGLPRGPTTQSQALILLAGSLTVGLIAGFSMRSAWAMLLVPVVHVIVLEFSRPQLLVRFGYANAMPRSLRRPVSDVLE
jgi:proline iminopeptidase